MLLNQVHIFLGILLHFFCALCSLMVLVRPPYFPAKKCKGCIEAKLWEVMKFSLFRNQTLLLSHCGMGSWRLPILPLDSPPWTPLTWRAGLHCCECSLGWDWEVIFLFNFFLKKMDFAFLLFDRWKLLDWAVACISREEALQVEKLVKILLKYC